MTKQVWPDFKNMTMDEFNIWKKGAGEIDWLKMPWDVLSAFEEKNSWIDIEHMSIEDLLHLRMVELSPEESKREKTRWAELEKQGKVPENPKERGFG